jgi:uncharacterized damage-inducible protein DinB
MGPGFTTHLVVFGKLIPLRKIKTMASVRELMAEFKQEAANTRKILERVPDGKNDWAPHEKSMKLGRLATHIAEILGWTYVTVSTDVLDFAAGDYKPSVVETTADRLRFFDEQVAKSLSILEKTADADLETNWTMKNGDTVYFTVPKKVALRTWVFNHQFHHRAQLGVYLRLLDVPVPAIYGPTADEQGM